MSPISQFTNIPKHVAIIMDGNGRWAKKRGLPRKAGHKQGAESARKVVKYAAECGVEYLTLFGFSSENWNRPEKEISDLMTLLRHYLRSETAELHKNGAKLKVIGDRTAFDDDILELIDNAEKLTADNTKITVIIALNYGGRADILNAAKSMIKADLPSEIIDNDKAFENVFEAYLMTADFPDPDLLIRTSGEMRISNFLLWQCAYAEMVFSPALWPDFSKDNFENALKDFQKRDRRYGGLSSADKHSIETS